MSYNIKSNSFSIFWETLTGGAKLGFIKNSIEFLLSTKRSTALVVFMKEFEVDAGVFVSVADSMIVKEDSKEKSFEAIQNVFSTVKLLSISLPEVSASIIFQIAYTDKFLEYKDVLVVPLRPRFSGIDIDSPQPFGEGHSKVVRKLLDIMSQNICYDELAETVVTRNYFNIFCEELCDENFFKLEELKKGYKMSEEEFTYFNEIFNIFVFNIELAGLLDGETNVFKLEELADEKHVLTKFDFEASKKIFDTLLALRESNTSYFKGMFKDSFWYDDFIEHSTFLLEQTSPVYYNEPWFKKIHGIEELALTN